MYTMTHKSAKYTILVGKDKHDNERLIDDATENDVWFHVADYPSSHVILKNDANDSLRDIPKQVIKRCACLCKSHSSVSSMDKCEIIYTQIKNVTKTDVVGQVIPENTKKVVI